MYAVYDGALQPGTTNGGPPALPVSPIIVPLDQNIVSLDIYNMSPFRLQISVSGGQPDIYFGPNSSKEHIYIGRQAGASLNVAELKGHPTSIIVKALTYTTGLSTFIGAFSIMGFREDEDWTDRKRPIVTGSISPVLGGNPTATQLVNQGNSQGTNVINTSSTPGAGSLNWNNDGSGTVKLVDNGSTLNVLNFTNGTNITPWSVQFGNAAELLNTNFYGSATLQTLAFQTLGNVGGIATNGSIFVGSISSLRQHVAVNTNVQILQISAPITGTYRVNGFIDKSNATLSAITFNVSWTAPLTGVQTRNFSCDNAGAYLNLRGTTTVAATVLPCFPIVFDATVGTNITVTYTDPSGTANDNVTAIVECYA